MFELVAMTTAHNAQEHLLNQVVYLARIPDVTLEKTTQCSAQSFGASREHCVRPGRRLTSFNCKAVFHPPRSVCSLLPIGDVEPICYRGHFYANAQGGVMARRRSPRMSPRTGPQKWPCRNRPQDKLPNPYQEYRAQKQTYVGIALWHRQLEHIDHRQDGSLTPAVAAPA